MNLKALDPLIDKNLSSSPRINSLINKMDQTSNNLSVDEKQLIEYELKISYKEFKFDIISLYSKQNISWMLVHNKELGENIQTIKDVCGIDLSDICFPKKIPQYLINRDLELLKKGDTDHQYCNQFYDESFNNYKRLFKIINQFDGDKKLALLRLSKVAKKVVKQIYKDKYNNNRTGVMSKEKPFCISLLSFKFVSDKAILNIMKGASQLIDINTNLFIYLLENSSNFLENDYEVIDKYINMISKMPLDILNDEIKKLMNIS